MTTKQVVSVTRVIRHDPAIDRAPLGGRVREINERCAVAGPPPFVPLVERESDHGIFQIDLSQLGELQRDVAERMFAGCVELLARWERLGDSVIEAEQMIGRRCRRLREAGQRLDSDPLIGDLQTRIAAANREIRALSETRLLLFRLAREAGR